MIILDANTKKLQVVSTVADLHWTASWKAIEVTCGPTCNPCFKNKEAQGLTTVGTVDMIPVVMVNTNTITCSNEVEYLNVHNSSGGNADITIQIDISATPRTVFKKTLTTGQNLVYNRDGGWLIS